MNESAKQERVPRSPSRLPRIDEGSSSSVSRQLMILTEGLVESSYPTPGEQLNLVPTSTTGRTGANRLEYLHTPPQTDTSPSNQLTHREEHEAEAESELPSWISPLRTGLDADMLWLLRKKKALLVPPQPLRDHLLRAYISYVHPFLPLLDLEEFLQAFESRGDGKISLVLWQAIMFAGAAFVDIIHLELEGFTTHKQARRTYYEKVRIKQLLFDADIELEPIVLIQVLLLLTYWFDKLEDTKSRCYWMRIAWSLANDRGLAHPDVLALLPMQQQKLRKRLWWCCFMRDQLISFSERRGSSLAIEEEDFPPLLTADFEWSTTPGVPGKYSMSQNELPWRMLSELCMAKVKLCILIRRVLCTQYELKVHQRLASTEPTMLFLPSLKDLAAVEHPNRAQELYEWSTSFFSVIRQEQQQVNEVETVHCVMLEMLYWTIVGMVHRAQLAVGTSAVPSHEHSVQTLREAAERTTTIARTLQEQDLLCFQPPIIVTALFGSAMQHLKDIVSRDSAGRGLAQQNLDQSLASLNRLQEIWFSADNVVNFLATIPTKSSSTEELETVPRPRSALQHNVFVPCQQPQRHRTEGLATETNTRPPMMTEAGILSTTPDLLHTSITVHPNHCLDHEAQTVGTCEDMNFELDAIGNVGLSNDFDFAQFDVINWTNILQI